MKIGIVMPLAIQKGGGEKMLIDLLENSLENTIEWHVIFLQEGPMVDQVRNLGISTYVILSGRLRDVHKRIVAIFSIAKIIRENSLDVIIGWMWTTHLLSGPAGLLSKIPSFWYELDYPSNNSLLRKIVNFIPVKGVITLSKRAYEKQKELFPDRHAFLVYPGVDLTRFDSSKLPSVLQTRHLLGLSENGPLIGIIGRMQKWKGIHTVIQAMPKILERYPTTKCVVVGGRHAFELEYFDFVKQLVHDLNLEEHIILADQQSNIPEWTQSLDVVIHASSNEPFGIVVIEGMALGKAIVAGADGGPAEIITPEVNGLLSPYEDIENLSLSVLRYLDDPDFAIRMGEMAKLRAQEFSTQKYAKNFTLIFQNIISQ
jgi:glycosyltransferase involved in cell wall biosynthesis